MSRSSDAPTDRTVVTMQDADGTRFSFVVPRTIDDRGQAELEGLKIAARLVKADKLNPTGALVLVRARADAIQRI